VDQEHIIALGLLDGSDRNNMGPALARAYPLEETPCFGALLQAMDDADRELSRERDNLARSNVVAVQE
jgi:hypothetical protein